MRRGGRTALGLAVACLAVAGCSDDGGGDAVTLPPTTPSATASAPTSTPPPSPTDSAEPTPTTTLILPDEHVESVDAFIVDFFGALNSAKDTGDFSAYDAMYLPQCTGCVELREEVQGWLAEGGSVDGADWIVLQQSSTELPDGSRSTFNLLTYRTVGVLQAANAAEPSELAGTDVKFLGGVVKSTSPWTIEDMGFAEGAP